jgi:uncharacterized protein
MKVAIIGGGASGMVAAYLLDQQGHEVTVFERQASLGGHIRTLNKNVQPNQAECHEILENGVLEFPTVFHHFLALMQELEVELEPVELGSGLFFRNGRHILSAAAIRKNFAGVQRLIERSRLFMFYGKSVGFWLKTKSAQDFHDQSLTQYLSNECNPCGNGEADRNTWLKLLTMYSYSMPYALLNDFPAELAIPVLRSYVFVKWVRIKGGVYSYIEKILERFRGEIFLNTEITGIERSSDLVKVGRSGNATQSFDKLIFATPPDQVLPLLSDPTAAEIRRFSDWKPNFATTYLHSDTSFYTRHKICQPSEFDFFQTQTGWGYNASLNQLCGITSPRQYSLAFNLESTIAQDQVIHTQKHHTPLYTVDAFRYRHEIVATNGENNTYHVGAYLADGLHEGAIASAVRVARLMAQSTPSPRVFSNAKITTV